MIEDVVVGQALELASRRVDQTLLGEAQRRAPQARPPLDVFLAILVIGGDARAFGDDERPLALMLLEIGVGVEIVGDVAAGGRIASLHGGCPRAWAIGYYPPPRALKSNPSAGVPSVVGRWRICDGAATTRRSARPNFLIRLG